ncbi:MAG: tetratricopeptide repeat protein [Treponema sp.]|jgi:outer membrane protein assembly factor BamD (BamD/ComL family)|nr:tetratricopeptide repeat protein [Treponema sp.]
MKRVTWFGLVAVLVIVIMNESACASRPVEIPADLTPAELIQRAQEATDRNNYKRALQFYEAIIERYPFNTDDICAAEYEIAFIDYKQKNYETAITGFNALLARYEGADAELLPSQYRVLAELVLGKIADKQKN